MADYERMLMVRAPADKVFEFASDTGNLSRRLPGLGGGAQVKVDRTARRIEWESGWLHVQEGDVTPEVSEVTVHLTLGGKASEGAPTSRDEHIQDSIEDALEAIRNAVETPPA